MIIPETDKLVLCIDLRILNDHPQIQSFSAFNSIYNNTGIFGIHASTVSHSITVCIYG